MISHPAPHSRQHTPWLTAIVALIISAAFASAAHAQTDAPPSRAVASVETLAITAVEMTAVANVAPDAVTVSTTDALPAPELAREQEQIPFSPVRRIDIGSATQDLLALQRASPGVRPRPIDGEQASRSYQRYLKSFETTIPEQYGTGMDLKKQ